MTRILADLPDEDIKWLDQRAAEQGTSRASVLREAVKHYRVYGNGDDDWIQRWAGLWADRAGDQAAGRDGVAYQRAVRADRRPSGPC